MENHYSHLSTEERVTLMLSAGEVALIAVRGLERNRAIIVSGWRNRLLTLAPRFFPRLLVRRFAARLNRRFGRA